MGGEVERAPDWESGGGLYWDEVAERWLESHPQVLWRRHSDSANTALLERWLPSHVGSVLKTDLFDEAVSEGLYPVLAAHADRVVGIDASSAIVAAAHARHSELVAHQADVRGLPFADGEFDAVVSNSTLDHFDSREEIEAALRELERVLRTGGTLVLTLDNPWHPVVAVRNALPRRARAWLLPYYVGATLGLRQLQRLLPQLGFRVVHTGAVVHAPRALAVVVANQLERHAGARSHERYLRLLMAVERLPRWQTRFLTGYFVAVRAIKLGGAKEPERAG